MPVEKLKKFLNEEHVKYVTIRHSRAYTAQEIAASAHIPGQDLAKTVMLKINGKMAMAVLSASYQVDFDLLCRVAGTDQIELASEREFKDLFPGCETGAMPPFGNLYGMDVYVALELTEDDLIAFNAGSHTELIQMTYSDFERLVRPRVMQFARHEHA